MNLSVKLRNSVMYGAKSLDEALPTLYTTIVITLSLQASTGLSLIIFPHAESPLKYLKNKKKFAAWTKNQFIRPNGYIRLD